MKKEECLHTGHRARMRERFEQNRAGFAEHEILEMLLYYTIPRADTNDLSHLLIEAFGSLRGVLEADLHSLLQVEGCGRATATYLSLLGETACRYAKDVVSPEKEDTLMDTHEKIARLMYPKFVGVTVERAYAILLDNGMRLLDIFHVGDGTVSQVSISSRRIVERVLQKNAAAVVLVHNHPNGMASPSREDISLTRRIAESLALIDTPLLEHFVFAGQRYAPIMCRFDLPAESESMAASPLYDKLSPLRKREEKNF